MQPRVFFDFLANAQKHGFARSNAAITRNSPSNENKISDGYRKRAPIELEVF